MNFDVRQCFIETFTAANTCVANLLLSSQKQLVLQFKCPEKNSNERNGPKNRTQTQYYPSELQVSSTENTRHIHSKAGSVKCACCLLTHYHCLLYFTSYPPLPSLYK